MTDDPSAECRVPMLPPGRSPAQALEDAVRDRAPLIGDGAELAHFGGRLEAQADRVAVLRERFRDFPAHAVRIHEGVRKVARGIGHGPSCAGGYLSTAPRRIPARMRRAFEPPLASGTMRVW